MDDSTPVTDDLAARNIPHRFFHHPGPVQTLEQAARERGQSPEQVIRTILFRLSPGEFALVLVAGPARISWRALRAYLGRSRLTTAREAEVQEVTGYPVGAVSPFGLPKPLRTLVDEGVTTQNGEISIGAGVRHATVILTAADLLRALGDVEIGQFTETD